MLQILSARLQDRREEGQCERELFLFQREKDLRRRDEHPFPFSRVHRQRAKVLCSLELRRLLVASATGAFSR
jgi:hypothetical protein